MIITEKRKNMSKQIWKPGNMVYPLPAVLVTCTDGKGNDNVLTIAWTGTICTDPALAYISVRPERHSYNMIKETGEFVINLTTEELVFATDYCGVRSGKDEDKFKKCHLTKEEAVSVKAPLIKESPVNIECRVRDMVEYGSHTLFVADVLNVHADEKYIDETGKFCLEKANPICYSHGTYFSIGKKIGTFGYSVKKK